MQWSSLSNRAQSVLIAGFAFGSGALLYAAGIYRITSADSHPLWWRFVVLASLCLATLVRRRFPIAALVGGLVPLGIDIALGPSLPIWLIYSDLIYAAVLYAKQAQGRIVIAACAVASIIGCGIVLVQGEDWRLAVIAVAMAAAFVLTPIWWASSVRTHKEVAAAERARAEALTVVAELDRQAAVAQERNRMARDLHDVIAGHLSAIAIQSEAALGAAREDPAAVHDILRSVRANSVDALEEMRTMIGLLQSGTREISEGERDGEELTAPRRLAQLPDLIESAQAAGTPVTLTDTLGDQPIPTAVDHAAYRIAQEALTNALRHAPGRPVQIELSRAGHTLVMTVANPRASAATPTTGGERGLANMRDRATLLGGSLHAGSEGDRWVIETRLPLRATPDTGVPATGPGVPARAATDTTPERTR